MSWPRRASLSLVLLAAWTAPRPCWAQQPPADAPKPAPAVTLPAAAPAPDATPAPPTDEQIAEAIAQLGDSDFGVRERATQSLWQAGPAVEPALRAALEDTADPEVARRLRTILSNITYGITPDMSPELLELLGRYRSGAQGVKRQVADTLAQRGPAGARVLLKLLAEEHDPPTRAAVTVLLTRRTREIAVSLIGDGDAATAGRVLAAAAESGDPTAAMHYAAFLLVRGGLDEQIAAAQARLGDAKDAALDPNRAAADAVADADGNGADAAGTPANAAVVLTFLHRAKGDLPAARAAAERAGEDELLHNVLIEAGDWPALAARAAAGVAADGGDAQRLSFATAFHRLAGDAAGAERFATMLRAVGDREPYKSDAVAEGLFLNGRVDLGIDVLSRHHQLARTAAFHTQRLAFDELPRLLERARARDSEDLRQVEAHAARAAWYTGRPDEAAAQLAETAKACGRRRDFDGYAAVVEVAHETGLAEPARWYTVGALQLAVANPALIAPREGRDALAELFIKAKLRDASRSAGWWRLLRQRFPKEPAAVTFETVTSLDANRMPGDALQALCDASAEFVAKQPPEERALQLELIADTLAAAGRREPAVKRYEEVAGLADSINPARAASALSKLAAFEVADKQWLPAADRYVQAWSRDRSQPVPLYLSGWALAQAGAEHATFASARMAQARLLPLADQDLRHALYEAMTERTLVDDARRERDAILRTAAFMSWRRSEALRRAGDDAYAAGRATAAADLWERAFLDNNDERTRFVEEWANVSMPALIRRTRAVGLVQDGNVTAALAEADACLAMSPGDADSLIEIVTALDAANHRAEADALFARATAAYERLAQRHPQSGPLHNLCAWAAAKCKRNLDAALGHAKRAVELQPGNTANLDTLAETHFQRGEFGEAVAAMRRCAELDPDDPRHKEQIERFQRAAAEAAAAKG